MAFYGIVTQTIGTYTERQLREYPRAIDRTRDGAQVVPAAKARKFRAALRTRHVAALVAGGIRVLVVTQSDADGLLAS